MASKWDSDLKAGEAEELLARVRSGDEAALSEVLEQVQQQVYRFGMRVCSHPEDAEDVLQETLLTLARRLREFRGDAALSTYIYAVARSHCIKKRRKSKFAPVHIESLDSEHLEGRERDELDVAGRERGDPHVALERKESWRLVADAIANLDPTYKEVLVLRDIEGLSAAEVATVVDSSVSAVKSRLHRARRALRDALGTPTAPPGCPDIVEMFSRKLEDELDADICAQMEAHLASCERCTFVCDAIREDLQVCKMAPDAGVPEAVQARIKAALRAGPLTTA